MPTYNVAIECGQRGAYKVIRVTAATGDTGRSMARGWLETHGYAPLPGSISQRHSISRDGSCHFTQMYGEPVAELSE